MHLLRVCEVRGLVAVVRGRDDHLPPRMCLQAVDAQNRHHNDDSKTGPAKKMRHRSRTYGACQPRRLLFAPDAASLGGAVFGLSPTFVGLMADGAS